MTLLDRRWAAARGFVRRPVAWLAVIVLGACGEGEARIIVEVHSPMRIPTETDALRVRVETTAGAKLYESNEALGGELNSFPVRIAYEPSAETPRELVARAWALLAGSDVASSAGRFTWRDSGDSLVALPTLSP